jgi:hypothetical protein
MTKYRVVSDKVGTPGDEFIPEKGINVEALLEHGFIESTTSKKSAPKVDDNEQE